MTEQELCPYCQTQKVNTGAPIWEDYCPNRECNGEAMELRERLRVSREPKRPEKGSAE